jgi:PAS domain S-box-containing protein
MVALTLVIFGLVARHQWRTLQEHRGQSGWSAHLEGERRRMITGIAAGGVAVPVLVAIWVGVLGRASRSVRRQRQAEQALRESEHRYHALFESNPFPMFVHDPETLGILGANGAAVERYGYTRQEFLGLSLRDLRAPEHVKALQERAERLGSSPGSERQASRHRTRDGSILEVEVTSRAVELAGRRVRLMSIHDVTERKALEARIRHAQKMDAIGRLAGGVAHDFNNILNVVLGYAELTMRTMDESDRRRRHLAEILRAGEQAASLTRQLLTFGRGHPLQPRVLDLNASVTEMDPLIRRSIGEHIELVTALAHDPGRVRADPSQIDQVILNLVVNARDAMPCGGRLTIETSDVELDGQGQPGLPAGRYVMLVVADTGCGMPKSVQEHIFEPFFTTKENDKGTGLGLATVYGIVQQSGGAITVHSAVNAGTAFKIYLPRVEAPATALPVGRPVSEVERGTETILLVEDDPALRGLTHEVLTDAGYRVLQAASGPEAMALVDNYIGRIDLLVTDVVMPRMNGLELARRLDEIRPGLPTLYLSGYAPGAVAREGMLDPRRVFMTKPLRPAELTHKVRDLLDTRPLPPCGRDAGAGPRAIEA